METKTKGFILACADYFGRLPNQGMMEFKMEVQALTQKDKEDLKPLLEKELGYTVTLTPVAA